MTRLILGRLALAVPLLFIVSFLTFLLIAIAPGDPAATVLGNAATPERVAEVRTQLGLDQPLLLQYWNWLTAALHGDLGVSLLTAQPVLDTIGQRIGVTLSLVLAALALSTIGGVLIGMLGALRGGWLSRALEWAAVVVSAIPPFWLGFLLIAWFALQMPLLPATGYVPPTQSIDGWIRSLILPVATLVAAPLVGIAKQTKDSMQEALAKDFVAALRADGRSEMRIIWAHVLKSAAIPIVTIVGVFFIAMIGGTVFAETVFSLPGLGTLVVGAAQTGDFPLVQGVVVVLCLGVVIVNLVVEMLYGWLNPKARMS
ncbi:MULTISPECIES: ABC transporter permease [unclassified Microbacterium]|uniref:ABC transporter permease n=1 Tax=unclassified Microbacterium TaxID=2609290 RepID=UPI00214B2368|nr:MULTISPECIES: ABC transporter permease [unclassified Microbacterium]MCR2783268.1 ABC transporter permease [Microbacterium sp. zg.B96]WIM15857.1 ABC transporter permease [Microbacterium sp. zg-B96]